MVSRSAALAVAGLVALAAVAPGVGSAQDAPAPSRPTWPWAVVAVGGAMLAGAVVTGSLALVRQGELDRVCAAHSCPPSHEGAQLEGRILAFSTDGLWIGGLVVATAGLVLALALPADAPAATASCGPDGCALVVRGVF